MQWQWIEVTIGYDGTATMYANGVKVSSNKFNMENFMIKGLCDR